MSRLPTPGSDDDTWGNILNDFLGVVHNADGTLKTNAVTTTSVTDASITEAKLASAVQTKLNAGGPDATTLAKGVVQLAGDLGGTAAAPTVPGLAGKASTSHTHTLANVTDVTATATELNYTTNVTSDIQTQLNGKQASGSYAAAVHTHTLANVTDVTATATELNYTTNVTSDIQTQLNGKSATGHTHTLANITDFPVAVSATELGYLNGVTSAIQTQFSGKAALSHTHPITEISGGVYRAKMLKTTGQTYSANTWTKVVSWDLLDMSNNMTCSSANGTITIPVTGRYDVEWYQRWQSYGTAYDRIGSMVLGTSAPATDGSNVLAMNASSHDGFYAYTLTLQDHAFATSDVITFWVRSAVGSTMNTSSTTLPLDMYVSIKKAIG